MWKSTIQTIALALALGCAAAQPPPKAETLLAGTPFRGQEVQQVLDGAVLGAESLTESRHELSVGLACLVAHDRPELMASLRDASWRAQTPSLLARGEIQEGHALEDLGPLGYTPEEWDEIAHYLHAGPGSALNLSSDEYRALQGFRASGDRDTDAKRLSALLQRFLAARYRAYREKGLDGIAPYAREDGTQVRAGAELRRSLQETPTFQRMYPALYEYLMDYPRVAPPPGMSERFFWGKLIIEGRPAVGLSHRVSVGDADSALLVEHAFYVSHTLNASLTFLAVLPVAEGKLLFYVNRVWTDRVGGFARPIRKFVGRHSVLGEMRQILDNLEVCASPAYASLPRD